MRTHILTSAAAVILAASAVGPAISATEVLVYTAIEADQLKAYEAALETAREMGWEIVSSNPEAGLIEATATTRIMNFKDDVAIRVSESGEGAAVDVRSVSRVGISDMGANANRIRTYLHALKVKLGEAG